jgi:hypothetical protein
VSSSTLKDMVWIQASDGQKDTTKVRQVVVVMVVKFSRVCRSIYLVGRREGYRHGHGCYDYRV